MSCLLIYKTFLVRAVTDCYATFTQSSSHGAIRFVFDSFILTTYGA